MEIFFESSKTQLSSKTSFAIEGSNLDIEKPPHLKGTCPVEIRQEHLPDLEKCQKTTQSDINSKTKSKKFSKVLVKSEVNLPKLKLQEIPRQRVDSGEPCENRNILPKFPSREEYFTFNLEKNGKNITSEPLINVERLERSLLQDFSSSSNPGPSECQVSFSVATSDLNISDFNSGEEESEESKALKRWEWFMKDKKRLQSQLNQRLGSSANNLQIQESDKYRQRVEDELLLTYAQLPMADKWRGHPNRWKAKVRLKRNKNDVNFEDVMQYTGVKTKIQQGKLPNIEFIGIPKAIQTEKGLTSGLENIAMKKLKKMPYRQERLSYYKKEIQRLKPHDIEMDELVVVGKKVVQPKKEESEKSSVILNLPEINIELNNKEENIWDYRQSIFCLVIEGEEVKYELEPDVCQSPDKVFTWLVDFGVNTVGSLVEKKLRIENRGTVTVSYNWLSQKIGQNEFSDSLPPKHHTPWFFFNKNSGFFLPGQIYEFKFYHKAQTYGIRKEKWQLKTSPPLSKNSHGAVVVLSAVATGEFLDQNNDLELYLSKRVSYSVVAHALEVLFFKVFKSVKNLGEIEYRSFFLEKALFECQNPKFIYHSFVLRELKEVFKQIPQNSQPEWDLSLDTLVSLIYNFSKNNEKKSLFLTVVKCTKKLLRPNYFAAKKSKTFKMSYNILCKMANFMEEDYDYIRSLLSQKKENVIRKTWVDHRENEENTSSSSLVTEEISELESNYEMVLLEIKPLNYLFFKTMLYLKVYNRVCEAVEQIVGVLETNKLFEPWKKENHKPEKPSRINRC